ncbi:muscle M-line assembly protein unc-89 Uncoordinated protein 89 [Paenibacillus sp. IHBB 3054]|uniref:muscle M-line assembly protein unc-89 Uncoordinated protein 89 n=1 Tax=Paenibacillus sp. IHBB 3054 TaxID=3425689 RepID=UPI003F6801E1
MNVSRSIQRSPLPLVDHGRLQRKGAEQKPGPDMKIPANPQTKLINQLTEQKQSLIDRRSEYVGNALKRGDSPEVVQAELASLDEQIQQLDEQIRMNSLENQRKTQGLDEDTKKKKEEELSQKSWSPDKQTPEEQQLAYTTYTLNGVISAHNDLKQSGSVRMAQITLRTEAKSLENSNPVKSARLFQKASNLDQKLMNIAKSAQDKMTEAVHSAPSPVSPNESPADVQDKKDPAAEGASSTPEIQIYAEANKEKIPPGSQIDQLV